MSKVFADNLKLYRNLLGMTQTDLAMSAGITRSAVNNYESAKSEPNFEVLCKFASILGVDIDDLITNSNKIPEFTRRALITEDERFLLDIYRNADPTYQNVAIDILRMHPKEGR